MATSLAASVTPIVVIETRVERVEAHRRSGSTAILGNATHEEVLKAAGVQQARHLLVAVPNGLEAGEGCIAEIIDVTPDINARERVLEVAAWRKSTCCADPTSIRPMSEVCEVIAEVTEEMVRTKSCWGALTVAPCGARESAALDDARGARAR